MVAPGRGFTLLRKEGLAPGITRYVVGAPDVARAWRPGQFVIVRPRDDSERIPLTVADAYFDRVVLVVQEVGKTTAVMADLAEGEPARALRGGLGRRPTRARRPSPRRPRPASGWRWWARVRRG